MDRPRLIKGIRIAVSAVCGILCVLLIALWVRSYLHGDYLYWNIVNHRSVVIGSGHGRLVAYTGQFTINESLGLRLGLLPAPSFNLAIRWSEVPSLINNSSYCPIRTSGFHALVISHWLLVLVTGTLAAVLGIRRPYRFRFSLRTMLIATAVIAALLGLAVLLPSPEW